MSRWEPALEGRSAGVVVVIAAFRLGSFANALGDVGGYRCAASEQLISELARTPRNSFDDPQRKLGEGNRNLIHAQSFVVEHRNEVDRSVGWLRQNCKCRS